MTDMETRSPAAHVPALAAVLKAEHFPTGERAALKRMALDGSAPLAFHRFMLRHVAGKGLARCNMPVSSPSPSELLVRFSLKQLTR
jgi:hypothetical protein